MKRGWGRGISSAILVLIILSFFSVFVVSAQSASLRHEFVNGDLKCTVDYFGQPANIVEPEWSWENNGVDLHISGNVLSRQYFRQNDAVYCHYNDDANDVELSLRINIPKTNSPPMISPFDNVKLQKGKIITIVPKINDSDGDAYEIIFSAPLDANGKWENTMNFATGNYSIKITARDTNGGEDSEFVNIELMDKFEKQRFNEVLEDQFQEREQDDYREIRDSRFSKIATIIKKGDLVDIDIEKEASGKNLPVSRALFSLNKDKLQITTEFRSLGKNAKTNAKPIVGEVYDYINVIMYDYNNNDISTSELEFKIDNQWLRDNKNVKIYQYSGEWMELPLEKIVELSQDSYFKTRTDGYGLFAVVGEEKNKQISLMGNDESSGKESGLKGLMDSQNSITGGAVADSGNGTNWGKVFFVTLAVIGLVFLVSIAMIRSGNPGRFSEIKQHESDRTMTKREEREENAENVNAGSEDMDEDEIKKRVAMMLQGKKEVLEEDLSKVEKSHKTKFKGYDETNEEMKVYDENAVRDKVRRELEF